MMHPRNNKKKKPYKLHLPEAALWTQANLMSALGAAPLTDTCRWLMLRPRGYRSGRRDPEATADWNSPKAWTLRQKNMEWLKGHEAVTKETASFGLFTDWLLRYSLADIDIRACIGLQAIMQTIIMGKIEMVLPDMYMMNRFMGICFRGPRATSQQRYVTQDEEKLTYMHAIQQTNKSGS